MGVHQTVIIFYGSISQTRIDIILDPNYYQEKNWADIDAKHIDQLTDFMTVYQPFIFILTIFGFMKWFELYLLISWLSISVID